MALPTFVELFGVGATLADGVALIIPDIQIPEADGGLGLIIGEDALSAYAAIIKRSYEYFKVNTDEAVMAEMSRSTSAPFIRNGIEKTRFSYSIDFYGSYAAPSFNPMEV